ncbi:MAG: hypothetical protein WA655_20085 [Candidatus Korobacteraceae bacterium]
MAARLADLEAARHQYGPGCAARVDKLLLSLRGMRFSDAESLIHFHDTLLFLRAFPQSRKVVALTEKLLDGVAEQVKRLRESGADLDLFDDEEFSGIAGTAIRDTFTYEVARWLAGRYPQAIRVDWDVDEQSRQMSSSLPQLLPLLADDCLVEADTPYLTWLATAAGGEERILPWLLQWLENAPQTILQKMAWYDALKIEIAWELDESPVSRTHARRNPPTFYYHKAPLLQRKQVSLAGELSSPALPVRKLSRREGEDLLHQVRAALTVRYRELYGTTRGDPRQVIAADVGRGVHIFLWGLPPDRRLPLRAYLAGITFKNGVPINYIEGIGLAEWMEVGFNTFYAFRDGETAWIYSKVLHLLHQVAGATCFSVYPYQLGQDNEEAINSGAFWFYRKLGFRPGTPELLALTEREEKKIASKPGYRTPARTLRKLAAEHVFYEFGGQPRGLWDNFSIRNIGFAVQRHMAAKFKGNPEAMRERTSSWLAQTLRVNLAQMTPPEQAAFADFAAVLALAPELKRWTNVEKHGVAEIIRAKAGATESEYLGLLQQHRRLKETLVRLGSTSLELSFEGTHL